jgi:2-polyprenyl-3-methyl-5-hydroxy-6-metoxy-1,4-benzoquinol methylase
MDSVNYIAKRRKIAAELSGGTSSEAIYRIIERVIVENGLRGSVLDYGAGVGDLTRRLCRLCRFHRVTGADIMSFPHDLVGTVKWIEQDLNAPIVDHDGEFDVVVAAEVIEHLENPRLMVRELFRLLRPGGTAIVSTPNNESWRSILALVGRGHFASFTETSYPAHITALLRLDLTRIFLEAKFMAPRFYFTDHGGIPKKPKITWQGVSLGLLRGLRFSDNLVAVAIKSANSG